MALYCLNVMSLMNTEWWRHNCSTSLIMGGNIRISVVYVRVSIIFKNYEIYWVKWSKICMFKKKYEK